MVQLVQVHGASSGIAVYFLVLEELESGALILEYRGTYCTHWGVVGRCECHCWAMSVEIRVGLPSQLTRPESSPASASHLRLAWDRFHNRNIRVS